MTRRPILLGLIGGQSMAFVAVPLMSMSASTGTCTES